MPEKLVRDKIPEIVAAEQPGKVTFRVAAESERLNLLMKKLEEECEEFLRDPSVEEAADVLEVLRTIAWHSNKPSFDAQDLAHRLKVKANEKGGFAKFYVMDFPGRINKPDFPDWECQHCHRKERGGSGKPTICPTCGWNIWEQVDPLPIGAKLPEGEKP